MLIIFKVSSIFILLVVIYFLIVTRVSLIINSLLNKEGYASHVYWVYSNSILIWLTDRPIIVSAILFFNYRSLVDAVSRRLNPSLDGKRVLQLSCAFGNITERIAEKCIDEGAKKVVICDLVLNEIKHTKKKLRKKLLKDDSCYLLEDAVSLAHRNESFDYVVLFFLIHELPYDKKVAALKESARVLKPGGKIIIADFHKPEPWVLRISGYCFFKVFEPFAHEVWDKFDAVKILAYETPDRWEHKKKTFFRGNYHVFSAEKEFNQEIDAIA